MVDLHMHSDASDGSDTPRELVDKLSRLGITAFALTDHDTVAGCRLVERIAPKELRFIKGIEFSCKTDDLKCHILGLGIDTERSELKSAVDEGYKKRKEKLIRRIGYLKNEYKIDITPSEEKELMSLNAASKVHLAALLIRKGYAQTIQQAINTYLSGCPSGNTRIPIKTAVSAIKSAGGIAVWAHPLGGEGEKYLSKEEFEDRLSVLIAAGIDGIECFYSRYTLKEAQLLKDTAAKKGLLISGGSDYHGINKNIEPAELNTDGKPVPSSELTVLERLI